MKLFTCLVLLAGLVNPGFGQSAYFIDSLPKTAPYQPVAKKQFVRSLILPTVAILYGASALRSGTLQDWNATVQKNTVAGTGHRTHIDDYLQYTPALAGHVLSIAGIKGKHKLFDRLMIDGIAAGFSITSVLILKQVISEKRPDGSDDRSFPSNHTATAFCSAELLREEYSDVSPWYGIAGYSVAVVTGYLRLYNNNHWLGDVVAGAGIGILSAKLANKLFPLAKRILFGQPKALAFDLTKK